MSSTDLRRINKIEVPFVVVLGERPVQMRDILSWVPGSIVELGKEAEEELEVRINNKAIGTGKAVKVGENFGVQINQCGNPTDRIEAMGSVETSEIDTEIPSELEGDSVTAEAGESSGEDAQAA